MNKIFHKIICLAVMLMACDATLASVTIPYSEATGDCTWSITQEGQDIVLTISPNNASQVCYMGNWPEASTPVYDTFKDVPWYKKGYADYITKVVVEKNARFITCAHAFAKCSKLKQFSIDSEGTVGVTNMNSMFWGCSSLLDSQVNGHLNFDTSSVTDMTSLFNGCTQLNNVNISGLNTTSVNSMAQMFAYCFGLQSFVWPETEALKTNNVTSVAYMFYNCTSLTTLDMRNFDFTNLNDCTNALYHDKAYHSTLTSVYMPGLPTSYADKSQKNINTFLLSKIEGVTCAIYFPTGSKSDFTNTSVMTALNIGTTNYPYTLGQYVLAGDITDNYTTIDPDYTSGKSTTAWNFAAGEVRYFRKLTNNWGTVVLPYDIDKGNDNDNVSGCTFFYPSKIEDNDLVISRKQIEPEANKPCILHNSSASVSSPVELQFVNKDAYTAASTSLPTPNDVTATNIKLKGVYTDGSLLTVKTASDNSQAYYYYQADAFWHATARLRVASFHSYIYDATATSSSAKSLNIVFDDEDDASGIEEIETGVENAAAYNLAGQRLAAPAKGQINIIKGKKVIVK